MAYVELDSLRQINDKHILADESKQKFKQCRICAGAFVRDSIKEKGFLQKDVADSIGVDRCGFTSRLQGEFTIPLGSIVKLCNYYLLCSCNQLMFGEDWPTELPVQIGSIVNYMVNNRCEKDFVSIAQNLYNNANNRENIEPASGNLAKRRILELAANDYVYPTDILKPEPYFNIKLSLRKYILTNDDFVARLTTLMYFSFFRPTTLDYFLIQDYTRFAPIGYRDNAGRMHEINDEQAKKYVSYYLRLNEESQQVLVSESLRLLWALKGK